MPSAARRFKANRKIENQQCIWCGAALQLGADAALCEACETPHHAHCWDEKGGCAKLSCANAPLRRMEPPAAAQVAKADPDQKCPRCGRRCRPEAEVCPYCKIVLSPDGLYHGPKTRAPGALASVIWGSISLLFCGIIFGPVAISQANSAQSLIESDPTLEGQGLATAGRVLGILGIVFWAIYIFFQLAST
jgi:hypothetical protein